MTADDNADIDLDSATEPCIITDTHIYSPLPIHRWPEALPLILERVGPDATIPSPDTATLLAARSLSTGEIDGVLFLDTVLLADRFAANPGVGVSFTAFHNLIASLFGRGALYYTTVCDTPKAHAAAERAGLRIIELLAIPEAIARPVGEGGEDVAQSEHAGSTDDRGRQA